jgi:hypothetical protein
MHTHTDPRDQDDLVQNAKSQWDAAPATTNGRTTKAVKSSERRGWKAILIRQTTFDELKELMRAQDRSKKTLDLAGLADGLIGHMLSDPLLAEAGTAEGRNRKRDEILAAANEWAD